MTGQSFNSTLVQLKDWNMISGPLTCTGFNSTLVQLKVEIKYDGQYRYVKFQFYLSSIKSR